MFRIGPNEERAILELSTKISAILDSVGLLYRIFFRIKSPTSIEKKLLSKAAIYRSEGKKMQDVLGLRVTLYFFDDEPIAIDLIKRNFEELPEDHNIDLIDGERFGPQKNNLVFRIPKEVSKTIALFENELIDDTFEVQFRTVFSEGWHEIEHDLRYKCKEDWTGELFLSRQLNGQLATLNSCDWAMLKIFDELAYKKYKSHEWSSFFRNVIRIRFENKDFSPNILHFLDTHRHLPKELLRRERENLIIPLSSLTNRIPLLMDNVLFAVNRFLMKDADLISLEPPLLKQILDNSINGTSYPSASM